MDSQETRQKALRVTEQLRDAIGQQAHERWPGVRIAERNAGSRHVWRFRFDADATERFLHVPRQLMAQGEDAAATLLTRLREAGWLDRLQNGPESSFVLSPAGRLQAWPRA